MDLNKLEQAVKLKDSGAITADEFQQIKENILNETNKTRPIKERKTSTSRSTSIIGIIFIVVTMIGFVWDTIRVPSCQTVHQDVLNLVNAFEILQRANIEATQIHSSFEKSYDKENKSRTCQANLQLNNSENVNVTYTLKKQSGIYLIRAFLTDIPNCQLFHQDLLQTMNNMPYLKANKTTAIRVNSSFEKSYDTKNKIKYCQAHVQLSNAEDICVAYKLEEQSAGQYYIEITLTDE